MVEDRAEFKPFRVESRARPYRLAFLVDADTCPPDLIDTLFETNYGLWGGRFNPIVPVYKGEIAEPFWSLLKYTDPDLVYTYTQLAQSTINRMEREILPWHIEAHPPHLLEPHPKPHFVPWASERLVNSRQALPLVMSQRSRFIASIPPTLLTYFHDWKSPRNEELVKLVTRNFGIIEERAFPPVPEAWTRLQVQNNWTPADLFHHLSITSNLILPFQASAAHAVWPPRIDTAQEGYCIIVGESTETWLYFWNRIFLIPDFLRLAWNTLCLSPTLLREQNFVAPLREFLKRHVHRSGNSPSGFTLESFECSAEELTEMKERILNGLDVIRSTKKLHSGEFPTLVPTRSDVYLSWGDATLFQEGMWRESLLNAPRSSVPMDQATWVMDLRIQYIPRFPFYGNEVLSWKLPRRVGIGTAFFSHARCRIGADYSLSVEMRDLGPFMLRIPDESEILHRATGIMNINSYDANLKVVVRKPRFRHMGLWDKGLYLNGILELFGGLQSASRFFEHSFWRGIFERLSLGTPEKETGLIERVRNTLEKKKVLMTSQLTGGHNRPIEWLSRLVIRIARELQVRQEEISFSELESTFLEQREHFMITNPQFRTAKSAQELEEDRKSASTDLRRVLQQLTNSGVLQQGIRMRCHNCGSRFWREMGTLEQRVTCDGCNVSVPVPVESVWRYRLNSLVRNGIALHGSIPVISALRHLREWARESFIYTHGVALFKNYDDPQPEAEVDLLCISDGKLVCGEVKSSAFEFTREELEKLAQIAVDISADQVAISAFNDPNDLMMQHSQTLSNLLPHGCAVVVCRPSALAFEPQPHAL